MQILMEAFNGVGIILENRYYGDSWPFETSTTDELAYLTTEQTIADNVYFAQHATFPGLKENISAPGTPWILYGGSLAGGETAFSIKEYGSSGTGILWGGIASSAPVHAQIAYPQWYYPIQQFAPGDCTASINAIIDKMDRLVAQKNEKAINELKEIFGLGALKDIRDFAMTIAFPMGGPMNYPTNTWQELNWYPAYTSNDFWNFCNNVTNLHAPENISAVDFALAKYTHGEPWQNLGNYANYVKQVLLPLCPSGNYNDVTCFGTQNKTFYAETANSGSRSYLYTTCTEFGLYQVAEPSGPSLISRVLQKDYTQQWCEWAFKKGRRNSIPPEPDVHTINKYGDFNISAERLALIDGEQDVWRDVCYHSRQVPNPRYSSLDGLHPEHLIAGAGHHWDSYGILNISAEPQFIQNAHLWELRVVERWLEQWKGMSTANKHQHTF